MEPTVLGATGSGEKTLLSIDNNIFYRGGRKSESRQLLACFWPTSTST